MKANLKLTATILLGMVAGLAIIGGQACGLGKSESYETINAADLTSVTEGQSDQERRMLAQNEAQRKGMVGQIKQLFSLAQAAQAEGIDKTENFKQRLEIMTDLFLIAECQKRNIDIQYKEEEGKAYVASHAKEFDAAVKMISEGRKETPTAEELEMLKGQWGEMKVRGAKARQSGIEKEAPVALTLKFRRANVLAELYTAELQKKLKPTPEEMKKYLEEHPEADVEKIKQKAEELLARVKKGEDFNAIATQFTEDGSREQGGDLGWFPKGKMDPVFENVAWGLQKGQTSELVKTKFGFHIIKLDDRRMSKPAPAPKPSPDAPPNPAAAVKPPEVQGPQEEIKARHIYLSTQEADAVEEMLAQKKIKRAMEDVSLQYPVKAPEDFTVNAAGIKKEGGLPPSTGSGRLITPQ
ncbi:MAG: peptidylprolyl isomerase [Acidobacteriota bacterium]